MVPVSSLSVLAATAGSFGAFSGIRVVSRSGGLSASAIFVFRSKSVASRFANIAAASVQHPSSGFLPSFNVTPSTGSRQSFAVVLPLSGAVAPASSQWFAAWSGGRPAAVGALAARAVSPPAPPSAASGAVSWAQWVGVLQAYMATAPSASGPAPSAG